MTMLAHQASFPASLGMGPQIVSARDYGYGPPINHRTPGFGPLPNNGGFASPTESEFSEPSDGPDSVR
jgi:hypothetical protein